MRNVAIICGGLSSEFEISLKSATTIIENFPDGYKCHRIIMDNTGWWHATEHEKNKIDLNTFSVNLNNQLLTFDLAVVYIHGYPGEDGKVQAYLDMMNIPYLYSNALASEL